MLAFASGGGILFLRSAERQSALEMCDIIDKQYYRRSEERVRAYVARCRESALSDEFIFSRTRHIARLNDRLRGLPVSHLSIFSPQRMREVWENTALDTGVRAREFADSAVIVVRVVKQSPAVKAGLRPGDELLTINGRSIMTAAEIESEGGHLRYRRDGTVTETELELAEVSEDFRPVLSPVDGETGLLSLQSFLPQYFDDKTWLPVAQELTRYRKLVIDLRGNHGGSFPAMLRALSPFRCANPSVGTLRQAEQVGRAEIAEFPDDLDLRLQLSSLASANAIRLQTFERYGCFSGPVVVLIGEDTASTAEIFAQSFLHDRPHSRVLGENTAGEVVLAKWIPLPSLGNEQFAISVPIAGYETLSGEKLEGEGVKPHALLEYRVADALRGVDTWIEAARSVSF